MIIVVESDVDSVFDEGNISSAQQILNQGAGRPIIAHHHTRPRITLKYIN